MIMITELPEYEVKSNNYGSIYQYQRMYIFSKYFERKIVDTYMNIIIVIEGRLLFRVIRYYVSLKLLAL